MFCHDDFQKGGPIFNTSALHKSAFQTFSYKILEIILYVSLRPCKHLQWCWECGKKRSSAHCLGGLLKVKWSHNVCRKVKNAGKCEVNVLDIYFLFFDNSYFGQFLAIDFLF